MVVNLIVNGILISKCYTKYLKMTIAIVVVILIVVAECSYNGGNVYGINISNWEFYEYIRFTFG